MDKTSDSSSKGQRSDKKSRHHRSTSCSTGPVATSTPSKQQHPSCTQPRHVEPRSRKAECSRNGSRLDRVERVEARPIESKENDPPFAPRFIFKRDFAELPSQDQSPGKAVNDSERDTIIKQRTELQMLISELRDRDNELNQMVQSHQKQLKSWEEDRLRGADTEHRCNKLERELMKRTTQIKELLKRLKAVENEAVNTSHVLDDTQSQLNSVLQEQQHTFQQVKELEEYNVSLQKSFHEASHNLGEREGLVSQLRRQLDCKESEALETSREVADLGSRLKSLEYSYKQLEKITFDVKKSATEWKSKFEEVRSTNEAAHADLARTRLNLEEQQQESLKLSQQMNELKDELEYTVERERRKDQLLDLQRSKQERTDTELSTLRQMYDIQQEKLEAARLQIADCKSQAIKQRTQALYQTKDRSEMNDDSYRRSTSRSPQRNVSPDRLSPNRSPVKPSSRSPERVSYQRMSNQPSFDHRSPHKSSQVVTIQSPPPSQHYQSQTSTDRLQQLLNDSKRLVETITSHNESPHTSSLLSESASPDKK